MEEPILHQVLGSAHGEGIRLILGHKGLSWHEVGLPVTMPRPLLTPLTGAYRRQPVLQVGADIYCDSRCIIRFLETTYPVPSLYPTGDRFLCELLMLWTEPRVFLTGAGLARYQSEEWVRNYFGKDLSRSDFLKHEQAFMKGSGIDVTRIADLLPYSLDQLRVFLELVDSLLADGRQFLAGASPSLADFSAFIPLYLINMQPRVPLLERFDRVLDWIDRVAALGYGSVSPMDAKEALDIACRSIPATVARVDADDPVGRRPGEYVSVAADDYGVDRVQGELVASNAYEIAIRQTNPVVGEVVLHFPKVGFRISPVEAE